MYVASGLKSIGTLYAAFDPPIGKLPNWERLADWVQSRIGSLMGSGAACFWRGGLVGEPRWLAAWQGRGSQRFCLYLDGLVLSY